MKKRYLPGSLTIPALLTLVLLGACGGGGSGGTPTEPPPGSSSSSSSVAACPAGGASKGTWPGYGKTGEAAQVLVFSRTEGYRHDSIPAGQAMLQALADSHGWSLTFTEDSADFTADNLAQYRAVVWLSTTGNVLDDQQQAAFEDYIESGGGYVGIHAAADTEYDWPWYGQLVGAWFHSHPHNQSAQLTVEDSDHPATRHLEDSWNHYDEWYNFRDNPREQVNVLLSLDETSYDPGAGAMGDHPIAWYHTLAAGRAFYTGLGHTIDAYSDPDFIAHVEGGLMWAAGLDEDVEPWEGAPPPDEDFATTALAVGVNLPMALDISAAGEVYVIGRRGDFYALEAGELRLKSTLDTNSAHEGGLVGFALDPDFASNRHAYFHYTDPDLARQHLSRITLNPDNTLDLASEKRLLSYPLVMECCHLAGDLAFDAEGHLYIATGDNTDPFESQGYAPLDERPGRALFDAQRTAANTNDLRGKILRITPQPDGSYTIPEGNLFTADSRHRGEIFAMGLRNPFRIGLDAKNGQLYWADVGPDANVSHNQRGPAGQDEINRTFTPGNFGWPYFIGNNQPYHRYDFASQVSGAAYDPTAVVNESVNNTGATALPDARPAWLTMSHRALMLTDIYRWNRAVEDDYKLPSYFHGRLLFWNFNNDVMYETATDTTTPVMRRWLDTSLLAGIIDAKVSPANHRLYLLAYGGNCCASPADSGMLAEVRYTGSGPVAPEPEPETYGPGDTISIRIDGQVVGVGNGQLTLLDSATGNSEIFELVAVGNDTLALRSAESGLYLSLAADGSLGADSDSIDRGATFSLLQNQDGSYALQASNCQFVSLDEDRLVANADFVGPLQILELSHASVCEADDSHGLTCRPGTPAYLNMPASAAEGLANVPGLLSQTGAFADTAGLAPAASLIPYDVISPLWSDGAGKQRWVSVPSGTHIDFAAEGKWDWPAGTVFVKHFELPLANGDTRRLETRLIVVGDDQQVYGVTYKWREDNSDADLLDSGLDEDIMVDGEYQQTWTYPGPEDCLTCHNPEARGILGVKTATLNKDWTYPSGVTDNQLRTLVNLGLFANPPGLATLEELPAHAALDDTSASHEHRLRSYWDINCGNCHGPQGIASLWDARYEIPLAEQGIIDGPLADQRDYLADYGLDDPKVVDPGHPENSMMLIRDQSTDTHDRMPPLGRNLADEEYLSLLVEWIEGLE